MCLHLNITFWLRPGNLRTSRSEASFPHPLRTRDDSKVFFFSHWVRMHYKLKLGRWLLMPLCMVRFLYCSLSRNEMSWYPTERFSDIYGRKQLLRDVHLHTTMPIYGIHFYFSSSYDIRGLNLSLSVWKGSWEQVI